MQQILFHLPHWLPWVGGMPIYGYGVMMVIGFFAALQLAKFLARRSGIDPEVFVNAGLIALVTGVIGARLSHVLENLGQYTDPHRSFGANFIDAINIRSGGLTFYGGMILATFCCIAYGLWKRVPVRLGMDIVAPALMVGLAFGRVGCFLNGCCYGAECSLPWGAAFPYGSNAFVEQYEHGEIEVPAALTVPTKDGHVRLMSKEEIRGKKDLEALADSVRAKPVQPTELYSAFNAFLIAAALLAFFSISPAPGRVFALMLLMDGASRFIMEMLRVEPPVWFKGSLDWSFSMGISAMLVIAGVAVAVLALLRMPVCRELPAGPAVFCVAGLAGALVARGTAYVGRFSIHLMPIAVALTACIAANVAGRVAARSQARPA